jgi:hypothetical protein
MMDDIRLIIGACNNQSRGYSYGKPKTAIVKLYKSDGSTRDVWGRNKYAESIAIRAYLHIRKLNTMQFATLKRVLELLFNGEENYIQGWLYFLKDPCKYIDTTVYCIDDSHFSSRYKNFTTKLEHVDFNTLAHFFRDIGHADIYKKLIKSRRA